MAETKHGFLVLADISGFTEFVTATELDEDVSGIHYSLAQYYENYSPDVEPGAAGLDGDLRTIFDDLKDADDGSHETRPAAELIRRHERQLMANVFRWTGHFPEKTRGLVRDLAKRAEALKQVYPREAEDEAVVAVTTLVTSLAMNFVHRGSYFPEAAPATPEAPAAPPSTDPTHHRQGPRPFGDRGPSAFPRAFRGRVPSAVVRRS